MKKVFKTKHALLDLNKFELKVKDLYGDKYVAGLNLLARTKFKETLGLSEKDALKQDLDNFKLCLTFTQGKFVDEIYNEYLKG